MRLSVGAPEDSRAVRLQAIVRTEREGAPFLVLTDGEGAQRVVTLEAEDERLWIGRTDDCDVVLGWDARVSRQHAELSRAGNAWAVSDDGLSRNGTWIGTERVVGRRRLLDGDVVRCGDTTIVYRLPVAAHADGAAAAATVTALEQPLVLGITDAQRRVLVALCRPVLLGERDAMPAGNREIAEGLFLSSEAVRSHLKALFRAFSLEDVPQNAKRLQLARAAIASGVVSPRDAAG